MYKPTVQPPAFSLSLLSQAAPSRREPHTQQKGRCHEDTGLLKPYCGDFLVHAALQDFKIFTFSGSKQKSEFL